MLGILLNLVVPFHHPPLIPFETDGTCKMTCTKTIPKFHADTIAPLKASDT